MVTVIIVNWNSGDLLERALIHLQAQTLIPTKVIVVDNGSDDGSADVAESIPGTFLLRLGTNLGFAAGNNRALTNCETEFVALINPDAFAAPDWLDRLVTTALTQPGVAAFGSRQMMADNESVIDGLGDVYHVSGLVWRRGYNRSLKYSDLVPCEIFSPCAGAALYRRSALETVGGFDEDFFCYVEDVDLGFRLRLAGYRAMYVPDAVVRHVGSATSGLKSDFSVYHGHRNLVWTFIKNMPGPLLFLLFPLHLMLNAFTLLHYGFRGRALIVLRAKRDALKGFPKMWGKRREIQARRRATVRDIWRALDWRIFR